MLNNNLKSHVFINKSKINFESKSQLCLRYQKINSVFINKSKIYFESKSQQLHLTAIRNNLTAAYK